jgi:hypothetical protein
MSWPEPGIYPDLSFEEYHETPNAWSHSQLRLLDRSPKKFKAKYIDRTLKDEDSASFRFGRELHDLVLGGELPNWVEIPAGVLDKAGRRSGKAWYEFAEEHRGSLLLKPNEYEKRTNELMSCCEAVKNEPEAYRLLYELPGCYEVSYSNLSTSTGLLKKARPDRSAVETDGSYYWVIDLKTTRDGSREAFRRSIFDFGYYRQAAWYLSVVASMLRPAKPRGFVFVTVEKDPPFDCRCYELEKDAIVLGLRENRRSLHDLARRLETNDWEFRSRGERVLIGLPPFAYTVSEADEGEIEI